MAQKKTKRQPAILEGGWCRITVHLPARTKWEQAAAKFVRTKFISKYNGGTFSSIRPMAFTGMWRTLNQHTGKFQTFDDGICLLFLDVPRDINDQQLVDRDAYLIRRFAFLTYQNSRCPQKEFWITIQPLWLAL